MGSSRQTHLDSMRGVAAFIVIILHFFAVFYPSTTFGIKQGYIQHYEWESAFHYFPLNLLLAGRFAVCLFFILSGYVLSYSVLGEKNNKLKIFSYVIKRPVRLGGLVLFTVLLGAFLWNTGLLYNQPVSQITHSIPYLNSQWEGDFQFTRFLQVFLISPFAEGTVYNPPLWTISIELYGSMLVFATALITGNFKYRLLLYVALYYLFKETFYQGFILGMLFADLDKNYKHYYIDKINIYSISVLLAIGLIYASTPIFIDSDTFNKSFYVNLPDFYSIGGSYAMNGAALVFLASNLLNPVKNMLNKPAFRYLGDISYGLYVMHFLVIGSFSSWFFLLLLPDTGYFYSSLITFIVSIPLIILVSHYVTIFVDKPAVLLAAKLGKKFQSVAENFNTQKNK